VAATPYLSQWKLEGASRINKAFIDADSAPGVATWGVTLNAKSASVGLQLVLLGTVYSQAQGCVCAALQLGGDIEQPWLMS